MRYITRTARVTRLAAAVLRAADRLLTELLDTLRRAWRRHRHHLVENPAYTAAIASGIAAILGQHNPIDLLAAVIATLLAVYAATRHGDLEPL